MHPHWVSGFDFPTRRHHATDRGLPFTHRWKHHFGLFSAILWWCVVSSAAFGPLCRLYRPASTVSVPFCLILACFVGFGVDLGKIFLDVRFLGDFVVTMGVVLVGCVVMVIGPFVFHRCSLIFLWCFLGGKVTGGGFWVYWGCDFPGFAGSWGGEGYEYCSHPLKLA